MQIVREDRLVDSACKSSRVVTAVGTDIVSDAGGHIARTGCRIAFSFFRLVDSEPFDNGLQLRVDLRHRFEGDARNLEALTDSQMNRSVTVGLGDILNGRKELSVHSSAGYPDT